MKIYMLLTGILAIGAGLVLFSSFGGDENSDYPSGSPAGYTGSPYDGNDCTSCHGGSSAPVADWITSDIPSGGYTSGMDYTITVTVTGTGRKGFEVSPHDANGNLLGVLTAGAGNKLVGNGKYVTQSSGSNSNPAIWNFTWTAPPAGTGEVTFWGAFCVNEPVTKTSSMIVQEHQALPLTVHATANPAQITAGDSSHLGVEITGGSGTYTYSWTSNPSGFFSTLSNPWAIPSENTMYIVEVSDGNLTGFDSVEVSVYGVGMEDLSSDVTLSLFPNPVSHYLTVVLSGMDRVSGEVMICSLSGERMIVQPIRVDQVESSFQVDLSSLPSGQYLLQFCAGEKLISRKMIKMN
ncbi:MAG: T9SS type A sorting domain-containing protein [Bacteroidales bacterium]|nr:T9SS type A sorting domain-containing protein [Bacteroidales bacterium]